MVYPVGQLYPCADLCMDELPDSKTMKKWGSPISQVWSFEIAIYLFRHQLWLSRTKYFRECFFSLVSPNWQNGFLTKDGGSRLVDSEFLSLSKTGPINILCCCINYDSSIWLYHGLLADLICVNSLFLWQGIVAAWTQVVSPPIILVSYFLILRMSGCFFPFVFVSVEAKCFFLNNIFSKKF